MRKTFFIILVFACFALAACSPKYLAKGTATQKYQKTTNYQLVILPPVTVNMNQSGNNTLSELAYKDIANQIAEVSNFIVTGDFRSIRIKANAYKYGALENTNLEDAVNVAKEMGAAALVISKISREHENYPIRVNIEIYDTQKQLLYSGQGRAANPLSAEAEIELAVEYALQQLKK